MLVLAYLQELRNNNSEDVLSVKLNDLNELNFKRGEVSGYDEVLNLVHYLDSARLVEEDGSKKEHLVAEKGA